MVSIQREKTEVLIIGSGGAGIRAAIEFADHKRDVLVVGKCKKRDAHTILATGGINAALGNMDSLDTWQLHAADTIRDGGFINDTDAVLTLCKNAPYAVQELARWGVKFHRERDGRITQRFFGAATCRRACFVGDHTGREILNVLIDQVEKRKVRFRSEVYIFSLLMAKGKVNGALGIDMKTGKIIVFHAKIVVLATGGHSRMFARSSSRFWENNGDGIALAYACGAKFMDMEMFQFHPTGMVHPPSAAGLLVTEAVRGEGGILLNAKGQRFMKNYDAVRLELSARDVVARAIYNEIENGHGTKHHGVWLDITHKPKKYILRRLPKMYKQFKEYAGIDISRQKMEVAPTAHYSMGGIYVNHKTGRTSVPNLFAIGEVTAGVHGGNRLGGNSLAEIVVFGRLTGKTIAREVKGISWIPVDERMMEEKIKELLERTRQKQGRDPIKVKEMIQETMWKHVGVVREEKSMKLALDELHAIQSSPLKTGASLKMNEKLIAALDVLNAFPTYHMIIKSAIARKESRAAHYRSDYPSTKSAWKKSIICTPTSQGIKLSLRHLKKVPQEVAKFFAHKKKPVAHLLE